MAFNYLSHASRLCLEFCFIGSLGQSHEYLSFHLHDSFGSRSYAKIAFISPIFGKFVCCCSKVSVQEKVTERNLLRTNSNPAYKLYQ